MSISIDNLRFTYPEAKQDTILHIPKWHLGSNEYVFIHGPSGCGKTTFLNILSGLLPISNGSIKVLNQPLKDMSSNKLDKFRANNIGCVHQRFNLISYFSPIENLKLANQFSNKKISDHYIKDCLNKLLLEPRAWHKPIQQLSIGQQQRVAIARALINQPKLIIADEPTSSLDEKNRDAFITQLMKHVNKLNCALILVSHDMALSTHFSRVESLKNINHLGACHDV